MCASTKNLNSIKIKGNVINNATVNRIFKNSHIKTIDLTECIIKSSGNKAQETFFGCYNLHTIIGTIDFSQCSGFVNAYSSCSKLVNVEFLPNNIFHSIQCAQSPLLSNESIQSIINGLATVDDLLDYDSKEDLVYWNNLPIECITLLKDNLDEYDWHEFCNAIENAVKRTPAISCRSEWKNDCVNRPANVMY